MDTTNADGIEYTDQHRTCLLGRIHTTLDQSVLPHIDLDLHHNVTYEQPAVLDLLTYIAMEGEFANDGAKTRRVDAGDYTGIRRDDRSPLAKALGYQLRQLDRLFPISARESRVTNRNMTGEPVLDEEAGTNLFEQMRDLFFDLSELSKPRSRRRTAENRFRRAKNIDSAIDR